MNTDLKDTLDSIRLSAGALGAELVLAGGILLLILLGLIFRNQRKLFHLVSLFVFIVVFAILLSSDAHPQYLFARFLNSANSIWFRLLFTTGGILTVAMTWLQGENQRRLSEYYAMILTVVLGSNLLVMSENLVMVFLSIEIISIPSYILTAFAFNKTSSEGSLKYFLFGSAASATMLYGFSLLYGITGSLMFASPEFSQHLAPSSLLLLASVFSAAGFLYKTGAAPMHPWAPDVYESAPMPVVALLSVVPKIAGVAVLAKFVLAVPFPDWQTVLAGVAMLTLAVGNFAALHQKSVRRLMAYSSIAQSGFLLTGLAAYSFHGMQFTLFYATVYMVLNFLTFMYLHYFENQGIRTIGDFSGIGRSQFWPAMFLLVAMVGLTGLPPTAGFTGKLLIFTSIWDAYADSGKQILVWLVIFGLLNTVISLFYYLRIPWFSLVRTEPKTFSSNKAPVQNFLGVIMVLVILILFFRPEVLMGWINKINFVF